MNWTDLPQDKMLEFVSAVFNKNSICEEITYNVLNGEKQTTCIFRPLRGKKALCENESAHPFGYCSKHEATLQAKSAQSKWEELVQSGVFEKPEEPPKEAKPVEKEESEEEPETSESDARKPDASDPEDSENEGSSVESDESDVETPDGSDSEEAPPKKRYAKVVRNKWGNYEHAETRIVFNPDTRQAYGVQHRNGDVYSLGAEQVEVCIRNGWKYIIPQAKYGYQSDDDSTGEEYSSD